MANLNTPIEICMYVKYATSLHDKLAICLRAFVDVNGFVAVLQRSQVRALPKAIKKMFIHGIRT